MAKFYGKIGFAEESIETAPGVFQDRVVEHSYYGDVIRDSRSLEATDNVNDDISIGNRISIVADKYVYDNFFAIRYISWMGSLWKVAEVTVEAPRLVLRLGGLYNGPTA